MAKNTLKATLTRQWGHNLLILRIEPHPQPPVIPELIKRPAYANSFVTALALTNSRGCFK